MVSICIWRCQNQEHQCQRTGDATTQAYSANSPFSAFFCVHCSGLDAASQPWGWSSALLRSPTQMLISFMDTLRNSVFLAIWASFSLVKLTHKITITLFKHFFSHYYRNACFMFVGNAWKYKKNIWNENVTTINPINKSQLLLSYVLSPIYFPM